MVSPYGELLRLNRNSKQDELQKAYAAAGDGKVYLAVAYGRTSNMARSGEERQRVRIKCKN